MLAQKMLRIFRKVHCRSVDRSCGHVHQVCRLLSAAPTKRNQVTSSVLMVQPTNFKYNAATAFDNHFQNKVDRKSSDQIAREAGAEFDGLVRALRQKGVVVEETEDAVKISPDAVFPNNWISFHEERKIVLYPMKAENRRKERQAHVVKRWSEKLNARVVDYTRYEKEGKYLEGTGSMVLDRENGVAYACLSERTSSEMFRLFCKDFGYRPIEFHATQPVQGKMAPIYHTNVVMAVGKDLAIVCLESIEDSREKEMLVKTLESTNKEIVPITIQQVNDYVGNVLELQSKDGEQLLVMSSRAYRELTTDQLNQIEARKLEIVHTPLDTIETVGGGGARCMLAEIFPPVY